MRKKKKVIESNTTSVVTYSGKVTYSVKKKDNTVNKKVLFNTGTQNLFKFIAYALCGHYSGMEQYKPKFLNLFKVTDLENLDPAVDLRPGKRVNIQAILPETQAAMERIPDPNNSDNDIGYKVTFKYTIPFVMLRDIESINVLGMYATDETLPSAYVIVTDDQGQPTSLIPASFSGLDLNDYVLSIQWEMQFRNK